MMRFLCCVPFVLAVFTGKLSVVACANEPLLEPCYINDLPCLKNSTKMFFNHTYKGIPAYHIVPIDPLIIPTVTVTFAGKDVKFESKNTKIEGLRRTELDDYRMNTKTKSISLMTSNTNLKIESDVAVVETKSGKRTPFHLSLTGSAVLTTDYNYELKNDGKGVEHFEVGPESTVCSQINPATPLDSGLEQALSRDAGAQSYPAVDRIVFCEILKTGYKSLIHNIRAAGKVLPTTAFFKNPHDE